MSRTFAIVTGASTGIGFELAKLAARHGCDLLVAADTPLDHAVTTLEAHGAKVTAVEADLATRDGVARLIEAAAGRPVDYLFANAGHGLGGPFLEQSFDDALGVINTNITGTVDIIQQVARPMVAARNGRILVVGSIAGTQPGAFNAVYNGSKAFINSFSIALREEIKDSGVTITVLMPGATETEFFERAGMEDTKVGASKKDDAADVAKTGFDAMMKGEAEVVHGLKNKAMTAAANILPNPTLAHQHAKMAEPGTATS